jgi:hypothetical protein
MATKVSLQSKEHFQSITNTKLMRFTLKTRITKRKLQIGIGKWQNRNYFMIRVGFYYHLAHALNRDTPVVGHVLPHPLNLTRGELGFARFDGVVHIVVDGIGSAPGAAVATNGTAL